MSKRLEKNAPLTLADVVELKKAALEQERQDAMFEAQNWDLMPDPEIKPAKLGVRPLIEAEKEALLNERMAAMYFWPEVINVPGATVEEKAVHLAARKAQILPHVWRKLLLDLVVDITPLDMPVPNTLIALLRDALELPENTEVGGWVLTAGMRNDRGAPDHEARECASLIDRNYLDKQLTHKPPLLHASPMPLNELRRKVREELGRTPDKKSLREWRKSSDYWCILR
jgi:hypothetical protein